MSYLLDAAVCRPFIMSTVESAGQQAVFRGEAAGDSKASDGIMQRERIGDLRQCSIRFLAWTVADWIAAPFRLAAASPFGTFRQSQPVGRLLPSYSQYGSGFTAAPHDARLFQTVELAR